MNVWTIVISVETHRKTDRTLPTLDFAGKVQFCPKKNSLHCLFFCPEK